MHDLVILPCSKCIQFSVQALFYRTNESDPFRAVLVLSSLWPAPDIKGILPVSFFFSQIGELCHSWQEGYTNANVYILLVCTRCCRSTWITDGQVTSIWSFDVVGNAVMVTWYIFLRKWPNETCIHCGFLRKAVVKTVYHHEGLCGDFLTI